MSDAPTPDEQSESARGASAPLGAAKAGRLVFASGVSQLTLAADAAPEKLYQSRSDFRVDIQVQGETVLVSYRDFTIFDALLRAWHEPRAYLGVNATIPWAIELRRSATSLKADLRELTLRSLSVLGAANAISLQLPRPNATISIRLAGGADTVELNRPSGVALRLSVRGKAANLKLDDQQLSASFFKHSWETPNYRSATARYNVEISGGAKNIIIASW